MRCRSTTGAEGAVVSVVAHRVDPDTLDDEIAAGAILILRSIEKACQGSMSGQPPDPDWASRLVQNLLVPPLPQNYRKSLRS